MTSAFESPEGKPLEVSEAAKTLVNEGVTPYQPDVTELLRQMNALQSKVSAMQAERGIPDNPVEFAVKNLSDHVTAHGNANPSLDTSSVRNAIKEFSDNPTKNGGELLSLYVDDLVGANPHLDLAYLRQLARDVRKAVLVADGATVADADLASRVYNGATV